MPVVTRPEVHIEPERPGSKLELTDEDQLRLGHQWIQYFRTAGGDLTFSFSQEVGEKLGGRIPEGQAVGTWIPQPVMESLSEYRQLSEGKLTPPGRLCTWLISALFRANPALQEHFQRNTNVSLGSTESPPVEGQPKNRSWFVRFEWRGSIETVLGTPSPEPTGAVRPSTLTGGPSEPPAA
ncbi:MAG: hypothetical protein HYY50_04120 [Candidatus Kerfeldbacteria bacterium]|nr:hypothetical protein [Candidatus Kerfeldbacteria bacterium]